MKQSQRSQLLRRSAGVAALLLALAAGCAGERPHLDLLPVLERGAFLPFSDLARLKPKRTVDGEPLYEYWIPNPVVPQAGWGPFFGRWQLEGERATLRYWQRYSTSTELYVEFRRQKTKRSPHSVELTFNGQPLGRVEFEKRRASGRLRVSPQAVREVNLVEFRIEPPVDRSTQEKERVGLRWFGFVEPGDRVEEEAPRPRIDATSKTVVFTAPGALVVPLELPEACDSIEFDVRAPGLSAGPEGPSLRILAVNLVGGSFELLRLSPGEVTPDWSRRRVRLQAVSGESVFLVLEGRLERGVSRLELRRPRILLTEGDSPSPEASAGPPEPSVGHASRRPDVVLIILDSARGDRFADSGYPRETVPNIRRMAREALVFERAYSECSNTACSVPNLITGVPFLQVGTVLKGWKLSHELVTLAEYLRAAGYRTVGISSTPNNSPARNSHQGFDRFERIWGPYAISERATEVIAAQPPEKPLFLQLHYLAPHQPYDPAPEFDRFTDPDYRGPITRSMSLRPYSLGLETLPEPDLQQLIGLYDGNLLMADDAVSLVLAALQEAGRWHDSLLLLTADHGEAFMEHGRQGHNTTLYDEMLHVPFILRLPGGEVPPEVDTRRLVSLADAVPTILGVLGITPAPEVRGIDILRQPLDPERPRVLFARTDHLADPMLSVRTPRWKMHVWPKLQMQELFDLETDPGETKNLVAERPLVFAGLGLLLRRHLERVAAQPQAPAERVRLSEEDKRTLRTLGYLE